MLSIYYEHVLNELAYLDALELLGINTGLALGLLVLAAETAREPERLPRLLLCCLTAPDDVAGVIEASARAMRTS